MVTTQEADDRQHAAQERDAQLRRETEAQALLARFAARRAANARLGLSERDSTDILRELRETIAR